MTTTTTNSAAGGGASSFLAEAPTVVPHYVGDMLSLHECCVWGRCQVTSYVSNTHDPQPQHSPMLNDGTYTAHNALPMCEVVSGESFGQTHANFSFQSPQRSTRNRKPQTAVTPQPPNHNRRRHGRCFSGPTSTPTSYMTSPATSIAFAWPRFADIKRGRRNPWARHATAADATTFDRRTGAW